MVVNIILEIATLAAATAVGVVIHDEICKGSKKARTRVSQSLCQDYRGFCGDFYLSLGSYSYHMDSDSI